MTEKLKPCPFCGGEAETKGRMLTSISAGGKKEFSVTNWVVRCKNRDCFMSGLRTGAFMDDFLSEDEAIEAWNKRA